ncbi:hypothetical protein [Micromonospora chalcea]|uniref:hypothetical protein n=1 Tax=Micromonospora chalcea TaxID=1874 RepID=UPI003D71B830
MTDVQTARSWTLVIAAPGEWKFEGDPTSAVARLTAKNYKAKPQWLTMNSRLHWRTKDRLKQKWREATKEAARAVEFSGGGAVRLPVGQVTRVRIDVVLHFPGRRSVKRDTENWRETTKVVVDALKNGTPKRPGWGFIPDDEPGKHLHCEDCPHLHIHPDPLDTKPPYGPVGLVVATLTDLSETR